MIILPVVYDKGAADAAEEVRTWFEGRRVRTCLVCLNEGDAALLPMIEGSSTGVMPIQAWLLPADAVELERMHRDHAQAKRNFLAMPHKMHDFNRLIILLDAEPSDVPELQNAMIVSLANLRNDQFDLERLYRRFNIER